MQYSFMVYNHWGEKHLSLDKVEKPGIAYTLNCISHTRHTINRRGTVTLLR